MDNCSKCKEKEAFTGYKKCLDCLTVACINSAKKYNSEEEWHEKAQISYFRARNLGIREECVRHWTSHPFRALYVFEHPDKSAYIGLTYNYDIRYNQHMRDNLILIEKKALYGQIFKRLDVWYPIDIVGQKENELIEEYRASGWTILNKNKGGALGGYTTSFWTIERLIKDALKYKTRKEWQKCGSGGYFVAYGRGILDLCCQHMLPSQRGRRIGYKASEKTITKLRKSREEFKKPIVCLNDGVIYPSIGEAANYLGLSRSAVQRGLTKKEISSKSLTFRYI